jgi:hypothetical protein
MNKISRILTGICALAAIALMSSCVKEKFDAPPENIPSAGLTANTTVAELYQYYTDSIPSGLGIINQDIIIKGIVVGTDESGNIYKTLYIQDNTAGLQISIDMTDIYTTYRLGQTVYIKCQGLYLGIYSGVMQLGYLYGSSIGRIPAALVSDHFFPDGKPGDAPVPQLFPIAGLTGSQISTLVRIDSVIFLQVGMPFSTPYFTTDRIVQDKNGSKIAVRTSNYANFAGKPVPSGYGSIVGILGGVNTDGYYEFFIRDMNDLIGFGGIHPLFFSEPFTTTFGSFTPYSVSGTEAWAITSYGATMSGYTSGNHANVDWLISPSFNPSNYTNPTLSFESTMNYGTAGDGSLKLMYSTDYTSGDPSTASWTEITGITLSAGGWVTTSTGNIDLSVISGTNAHIALKYISTTSSAPTWEITNIIGQGTPN